MAVIQAKVSAKKQAELALLKEQIKKAKVIGLVRMDKIGAKTTQEIRRQLRGKVDMRVSKRRIQILALQQSGKKNLEKLAEKIEGASALLFTDMDPLDLAAIFRKNRIRSVARSGDIAPEEILVTAGNTGLAPGPILQELQEVLKLQTKIQAGTVWIREDHVTHKKGEVIDLKQALLLARLGIEPIQIMLDFYAAWQDGEIVPREVLQLDVDAKKQEIIDAQSAALALAVAVGVITEETAKFLIERAVREAHATVLKSPEFIPGCEEVFIEKAVREAKAVEAAAFGGPTEGAPVAAATAEPEKGAEPAKEEKTPEAEKKKEEKLGEGLSSLFG